MARPRHRETSLRGARRAEVTWARTDDTFCDHPKVVRLRSTRAGREALGLWIVAAAWCARQLTDGEIPEAVVRSLGWSNARALLLADAGLWQAIEGGWRFHDWADYNPSRSAVHEKRAQDIERKRKSRSLSARTKPPRPRPSIPPDPTPINTHTRADEKTDTSGRTDAPPVTLAAVIEALAWDSTLRHGGQPLRLAGKALQTAQELCEAPGGGEALLDYLRRACVACGSSDGPSWPDLATGTTPWRAGYLLGGWRESIAEALRVWSERAETAISDEDLAAMWATQVSTSEEPCEEGGG